MRLYSIYEIEKLSKGRLSKYRLIQAIERGILLATAIETTRRGRGAPKFLTSEASLCAYLEILKKESRRVDALSNEAINDILSIISSKKSVLIDKKPDKTVDILIERIHALEAKNEAMEPLVRQGLEWMTREKEKTARRQELMTLLSDLEWYEFEKRKAIVEQLNTLG